MRIDAHQHFWKFDPVRDSWIDETMQVIKRDFLPKDLEPILKSQNIDGCVAVQADQSETETEFLLNLAAKNTFIKGVVGWVDLCAKNIEQRLSYFSNNESFKGVRHIVQAEANDFMLRSDFQNGIAQLNQFNLTYDILVYPDQLEAAIALIEQFPDQSFVIDHIAKPNIKDKKIIDWQKKINTLAKNKNIYCKISGMVTESDLKTWKPLDFTPYLDVIFEAFGSSRILYGSDWPVCLLGATYQQQQQIVNDYIKRFSVIEQQHIMGINASKFYNL